MNFLIIATTATRPHLLRRTLEELGRSDTTGVEVVVVSDISPDATVENPCKHLTESRGYTFMEVDCKGAKNPMVQFVKGIGTIEDQDSKVVLCHDDCYPNGESDVQSIFDAITEDVVTYAKVGCMDPRKKVTYDKLRQHESKVDGHVFGFVAKDYHKWGGFYKKLQWHLTGEWECLMQDAQRKGAKVMYETGSHWMHQSRGREPQENRQFGRNQQKRELRLRFGMDPVIVADNSPEAKREPLEKYSTIQQRFDAQKRIDETPSQTANQN